MLPYDYIHQKYIYKVVRYGIIILLIYTLLYLLTKSGHSNETYNENYNVFVKASSF